MTKTATTNQLRTLANAARAADLNQYPNDELWNDIDPDGTHVLHMTLPHHDHYRTVWMVKLAGTMKPATVMIDTSHELLRTNTSEVSV